MLLGVLTRNCHVLHMHLLATLSERYYHCSKFCAGSRRNDAYHLVKQCIKFMSASRMQVVMENLFALYPPAPPTAEERNLEQQQKAAAAAKLV